VTATTQDAPARKAGGAPIRNYIVLEQHAFEEDQAPYFVEAGKVEARNATNALRKAFRELKGGEEAETVLCVIPEGMWKPTPVKGRRRAEITVSVGE